jgi:hypothetical protein
VNAVLCIVVHGDTKKIHLISCEQRRRVLTSRMNSQERLPQYKDQCGENEGLSSARPPIVVGIVSPKDMSALTVSTDTFTTESNSSTTRSSTDPSSSEEQQVVQIGDALQEGGTLQDSSTAPKDNLASKDDTAQYSDMLIDSHELYDSRDKSAVGRSHHQGHNDSVASPVPFAFPVEEEQALQDVEAPTEEASDMKSPDFEKSPVPPESNRKIMLIVLGTAVACLLVVGVTVAITACAFGECTSKHDTAKVLEKPPPPPPPPLSIENVAPTMAPSAELSSEPLLPTGPNVNSSEFIAAQVNALTLSSMNISYPALSSEPTPEEMALAWLIERDPIAYNNDNSPTSNELSDWRMTQRYALVTLFHATDRDANDSPYSNRSTAARWFENVEECTWNGIECNDDRQVSRVDWYGRMLIGYLPDDVGLLSHLVFFGISANQIRGTLPSTIGFWTDLSVFSIFETQVTGTIPDGVANWTNITEAYFYGNGLTGTMPEGICRYVDPAADDRLLVNCPTRSGTSVECSCCTACV